MDRDCVCDASPRGFTFVGLVRFFLFPRADNQRGEATEAS